MNGPAIIRRQAPAVVALIGIQVLVGPADVWAKRQEPQPTFELSCDQFSADMSAADLRTRFGAANVVRDGVVGFDDGPQPGAVVFPGDPEARFEIIWRDSASERRPSLILVRGSAQRWRTASGIRVGTDLLSLERLNGRPFRLRGFRGEGGTGGRVVSWARGRLDTPHRAGCEVMVHLQPPYSGAEPPALMRQVSAGRELSSGHPALQTLNPRVVAITLWFGPPGA